MSICASTNRLPVSSASARANSSLRASMASATAVTKAPRSAAGVSAQTWESKALRAAAMAAIVSASPASETTSTSEPSAGQ